MMDPMDPPRILGSGGRSRADAADPRAGLKRAMLEAARREAAPPPEARAQLLDALGQGSVRAAAGVPTLEGRRPRASEWQPRPPLFASVLRPDRGDRGPLVAGALACAAAFALLLSGGAHAPLLAVGEPRTTVELYAPFFAPGPHRESREGREPFVHGGAASGPMPQAAPNADPVPAPAARLVSAGKGDDTAREQGSGVPAAPAVAAKGEGSQASAPAAPEGEDPGLVGGVAAESAAPAPSSQVLPFGEGMSPPRLLVGAEPVYPLAAREARIEGTMLARCVITTTGTLRSCRILKSLPYLEEPVLEALSHRRYTPVLFQGRPVDVEYVIPLRFELH